MRRAGARTVVALLVFGLASCDSTVAPTGVGSPGATERPSGAAASEEPFPTDPAVGLLGGPWVRAAIPLDDGHIAIISDACAAAAREKLGDAYGDLPTALVDAQGASYAIAIMADDLNAIECLVTLDSAGQNPTVELVSRLAPEAVAPVQGNKVSLASYVYADDRSRTVAFGRVGPIPVRVHIPFDDDTIVRARTENGWWATWWPGTTGPQVIAAVDKGNIAVGTLPPPKGQIEARIGPASWWIDPAQPPPTARSTEIHAQVLELACASGQSSAGRIEPPDIEVTDASIVVTFTVRHRPGGQDCQGHPPAPTVLTLPEPLGTRSLLDGNEDPPRDASKIPDH
jgi:hypothetical protein